MTSHDATDVASARVLPLQFRPLHEQLVGEEVENLSRERKTSHATNAFHENDLHFTSEQLQKKNNHAKFDFSFIVKIKKLNAYRKQKTTNTNRYTRSRTVH